METVINSLKSKSDTDNVLSKLKGFHLSLNFAVDNDDLMMVLCIIQIEKLLTMKHIYYKNTHTGQYMHFSSYTPWNIKTAWIKALYNKTTKICSNQKLLDDQMKKTLSFMSWNGFGL